MRDETYGRLRVRITGGTDREGGGTGRSHVILDARLRRAGDDLVTLARVFDVPRECVRLPGGAARPHTVQPGGRAWWWIDMMKHQLAQMRGEPIDHDRSRSRRG